MYITMSEKKDYSVSEFKAKALGLIDDVSRNGHSLTITKRGKPVARVIPWQSEDQKPTAGKLRDTILEETDIVSPLGPKLWQSLK